MDKKEQEQKQEIIKNLIIILRILIKQKQEKEKKTQKSRIYTQFIDSDDNNFFSGENNCVICNGDCNVHFSYYSKSSNDELLELLEMYNKYKESSNILDTKKSTNS